MVACGKPLRGKILTKAGLFIVCFRLFRAERGTSENTWLPQVKSQLRTTAQAL
jgi:hypothetical protein